jgi:hypothetical protein
MSDVRRLVRRVHAEVAGTAMDEAADRRIRATVHAHAARRHGPVPLLVTGAVAAAALVAGWSLARTIPRSEPPPVAQMAAPSPVEPDCQTRTDADTIELDGFCRHPLEGLAVETSGTARLRRLPNGVEMVSGWATFDVEPVRSGAAVEVVVSDGRIEVLGTRFVVFQGTGRGHVDLVEGSIRFVPEDGEPTILEPGERFTWGDLAAPNEEPSIEPPDLPGEADEAPTPVATRGRVRSGAPAQTRRTEPVDVPLDRIASLRAAGRYAEAVELIRTIDATRLDPRTAEVLSYEEGTILQDHLRHDAAACQHWEHHLRRFPRGRYRDRVQARRTGCEASP